MNSPDSNARSVPPSFGILILGNERRDKYAFGRSQVLQLCRWRLSF